MVTLAMLKQISQINSDIFFCEQQLKNVEQQIRDVDEWSMQVTQVLDDMPSGNVKENQLEALVARKQEKQQVLLEVKIDCITRISESQGSLQTIRQEVERIEDPIIQQILLLKHFDGLSWGEIGDKLGYVERYVQRKVYNYFKQLRPSLG